MIDDTLHFTSSELQVFKLQRQLADTRHENLVLKKVVEELTRDLQERIDILEELSKSTQRLWTVISKLEAQ